MKNKIALLFLAIVLITGGLLACQNSTKTNRYYDNNNNLFNGELGSLTENIRSVEMVVYENNQPVYSQPVLGYIYNEKYVLVPYTAFYVPTDTGRLDILSTELGIKLFLKANPDKEDGWKKEELGGVIFKNEDFAIVERIDPVFGVSEPAYAIGNYGKLELGDFLYLVSQENGALTIKDSIVSRIFSRDGKNLMSVPGNSLYQEWGGVAFALRAGKPELVGIFCVIGEWVSPGQDMVFVYFLDINQIIEEIEKLK